MTRFHACVPGVSPVRMCHPRSDRLADIVAAVAGEHGYTVEDLRGPSRSKDVAAARQAAMLRARIGGYSYPEIGRALNRDHTTVMHGVRKARARDEAAACGRAGAA